MAIKRNEFNAEDSQFALEKERAAKVMRRLFKPAEVIRCQIAYFPDELTAQVITPQQTYRYVRKPANVDLIVGDYVSVLNPGGENSGKNWEIINVQISGSASGVTSVNGLAADITIEGGHNISVGPGSNVQAIKISSDLNVYPSYFVAGSGVGSGTYVSRETVQSFTSSYSPMRFEFEHRDDDDWWHNSEPTKLTVKQDGWYVHSMEVIWDTNSSTSKALYSRKNGQEVINGNHTGGTALGLLNQGISGPLYLLAGDYIECLVRSNGSLNGRGLARLAMYGLSYITQSYDTVNQNIGAAAGLGTYVGVRGFTIPGDETYTPVRFDYEHQDDDNWWTPSHPTKLTVNTRGWYVGSGEVIFEPSATDFNGTFLRKNGSEHVIGIQDENSVIKNWSTSTPLYLFPGDYIELLARGSTGEGPKSIEAQMRLSLLGTYNTYNITSNVFNTNNTYNSYQTLNATYGTYNTYQTNNNTYNTYNSYNTYNTYQTIGGGGGGTSYPASYAIFGVTLDGSGSQLPTGFASYLRIPHGGNITKWTVMGDSYRGYLQVDIWKTPFASFPPVAVNTITGTDKPRLVNQGARESTQLTGWNTAINDGDVVGFNIDSVTYVTKATVEVEYNKNGGS